MLLNEGQFNKIVDEFMPRISSMSKGAMFDVICNGNSILSSTQKHNVTRQSLSKNLLRFKELQNKFIKLTSLFPDSHLLKETAHSLMLAEASFEDSKRLLVELCEKLGGTSESGYLGKGVKLYLDNTVTCIFSNPGDNYNYEWSFDQNDME